MTNPHLNTQKNAATLTQVCEWFTTAYMDRTNAYTERTKVSIAQLGAFDARSKVYSDRIRFSSHQITTFTRDMELVFPGSALGEAYAERDAAWAIRDKIWTERDEVWVARCKECDAQTQEMKDRMTYALLLQPIIEWNDVLQQYKRDTESYKAQTEEYKKEMEAYLQETESHRTNPTN